MKHVCIGALLLLSLAGATPAAGHSHRVWHRLPPLFLTGYDDYGRTATGTWARSGECAVDPRYIPFGAIIRIPGVGVCRAEDTGGAIVGYRVDVWRKTRAECFAITGYYAGATWWG